MDTRVTAVIDNLSSLIVTHGTLLASLILFAGSALLAHTLFRVESRRPQGCLDSAEVIGANDSRRECPPGARFVAERGEYSILVKCVCPHGDGGAP